MADNGLYYNNTTGLDLTSGGSERIQISTGGVIKFNSSYTFPTTDGSANQVLKTDGSGSLSWTTISSGVTDVTDEFTASASQTSFTLTQTPPSNSKVKMFVNGIRISNTAYSWSGTTLTYVPVNNSGYSLINTDRVQFDYFY